jgi:hypothetical protein
MRKNLRKRTKGQLKIDKRNKDAREASKQKIIDAMLQSEPEEASFGFLVKVTHLNRGYLNELLRELAQDEQVIRIKLDGKHPVYVTKKVSNASALEYLSCMFLHEKLKKVNSAADREKAVDEINKWVGSLVTYILTNYYFTNAKKILDAILPMIGSYLSFYPKTIESPPMFLGEPLSKKEPNVNCAEWVLWKTIDSQKYVTSVEMPKIKLTSQQPLSASELAKLPCSGKCLCDKASNGCMNRLLEAKRQIAHGRNTAVNAADKYSQEKDKEEFVEFVLRPAIDYSSFKKDWLQGS